MVLFIRIELYYWILLNNSQTKVVMSIYNMQKIQIGFLVLKCNIRYMNVLGSQHLRNFISIREKVVLVSLFQNKFYNAVFIFRFFMNLQRQNVTNVTETYVTNFSVESF